MTPLPAGTQHFTLDDDDSVPELGGSRPDRIATLSRPQERVLRRTVEQIVDAVPLVPLLDDPVPQTVEQMVDVLRFFDTLCPVSEQVIEVPKILPEDATFLSRHAAGGTAGGSADARILLFVVSADCGAARRHSSSCWWRAKRWSSRFSPEQSSTFTFSSS